MKQAVEGFVCIRVDFDANPLLVKRFGVKTLPDLRFLGADGTEVARLLGAVSISRFLAAARAASGLGPAGPSAEAGPRPSASPSAAGPTPEAVDAAVKRAAAYLRAGMRKGLPAAAPGFGPEDLVLYALVSAGAEGKDEALAKRAETLAGAPPVGSYQAALRALALARLDPGKLAAPVAGCARFLVESQLANGQWTYGPPKGGRPPALGDNSNTAFAILGLAACRKAGVEVPQEAIDRAAGWWARTQNPDGGWGYRSDRERESYASMTENGVASLLLCERLRGRGDPAREPGPPGWISRNFSVSENRGSAYQEGRLLYHLAALERLGSLLGAERIGDHDWYREGAAFLLGSQRDDGSWDDGSETPVSNTALGLLFLTRSTRWLR